MSVYTPPTVSEVRGGAVIATLREGLFTTSIPQAFRNCLATQMFLNSKIMEKGLSIQGSDLKLPPGRRPKTKTMTGREATALVNFEAGTTFQWVEGLEPLNVSIADGPIEARVNFSYCTFFVGISTIDDVENSGPMKQFSLLMERQNQEARTACTNIETALWSTNTDSIRGTQSRFSGFRHKISTAPTSGNLQSLDRGVFTPFRNQYATSAGSVASGGLDAVRSMVRLCSGTNYMEPPDLIITDGATYNLFMKQLEGIHRVVGSLNGQDLMAERLGTIMGVPIVWTDDCPAGYMYFFNFDYLISILQGNAQWVTKIPGYPNDQLVENQSRLFYGAAPNMLTRPERFGVISGFTA